MKQARFAFAAALLLTTACTTAGPFVTSISSDGQGGLVVEKSMVKLNAFMGTVSNEGSTTATIKLFDETTHEEAKVEVAAQPKAQ